MFDTGGPRDIACFVLVGIMIVFSINK